jgi:hypothetical protein
MQPRPNLTTLPALTNPTLNETKFIVQDSTVVQTLTAGQAKSLLTLTEGERSSLVNGTFSAVLSSTGTFTIPDTFDPDPTTFVGSISGTTLTVTSCLPGKIAWEQYLEGDGVAADTFIVYQLSGTSGGNGTYKVSVSQNIGPIPMNVAALFINGSIKLAKGHSIYIQDEHDETLYDLMIGIKEIEGTIHLGSINTNGVSITNNQEYKVESALNAGTFMAVAKVNAVDEVSLGSGNSSCTNILVGGMGSSYGIKLFNGGATHVPNLIRIGDNVNSSIFGAPLEVGSRVVPGDISPGGIALPTYRGTATIVANDEWGSYIYGSRYRGTANVPLAVKQDDWLMEFGATAFDGHGGNNGGGEMAFRVDGAVTASANPSRWELYVTPTGTNNQTLGLKVDSTLQVTAYGPVKTLSTTVNSLPSASSSGAGARAFVTDATSTTFLAIAVGSGNHKVPVVSDGTNWLIG